jgi:hypothetical protein
MSTPAFCATSAFPTEKSTASNYLCCIRLLTANQFMDAFAQPFAQDRRWNTDSAGQGEPRNYLDAHEIIKHFVYRFIEVAGMQSLYGAGTSPAKGSRQKCLT